MIERETKAIYVFVVYVVILFEVELLKCDSAVAPLLVKRKGTVM